MTQHAYQRRAALKPALTQEQWKDVQSYAEWNDGPIDSHVGDDDATRIYLMALNNAYLAKDSPHKFTREDVETVRVAAFDANVIADKSLRDRLEAIASRIAALLPP